MYRAVLLKNALIALVFLCIIGCLPSLAQVKKGQKVAASHLSGTEALRRLQPALAYLNKRYQEMGALYGIPGAKLTLQNAFRAAGITDPHVLEETAANEGNYKTFLTWDAVSGFYRHHIGALETSIQSIKSVDIASKKDVEYLETGVAAWKSHEAILEKNFKAMTNARSGRVKLAYDADKAGNVASDVYHACCPGVTNPDIRKQAAKPYYDLEQSLRRQADIQYNVITILDDLLRKSATERFFNALNGEPVVTRPID